MAINLTKSSNNPVLSAERFLNAEPAADGDVMTLEGTLGRSMFLLLVVFGAALWPWTAFFQNYVPNAETQSIPNMNLFLWGGLIAGLVLSLIISFAPKTAPWLAVPYAFCEGIFLGALSATFEMMYPGIALQAIAATFGVAMVMLGLYAARIIQPTQRFRAVLFGATAAIGLFYLVALVLSFIGVGQGFLQPLLWGSGIIGIGFSVVVCIVAALNLITDFGIIEDGVRARAPKYMSWYGAFALLVTLVWLYIEVLRLLAKLRGRD
ncbi:MAG: Bax inhibitor-1/YccA family protein [Planctomycetota bacterium]|jgi:uncharacterized YccA/Bax inhibitor family protein|nr:Bax inhibitor-1/YccA family protein [Planctomycetota bacterium]